MKFLIYCFSLTFFSSSSFAVMADKYENFANDFIASIESKCISTNQSEDKFFPRAPYCIYNSALLMQLGYMNNDGSWKLRRPEISYIGCLLELHKNIFDVKDYREELVRVISCDSKNEFYFLKILRKKDDDLGLNDQNRKVLLLKIFSGNDGKKSIILEDSSINGQMIPYLLGFRFAEKGKSIGPNNRPVLMKKNMDELIMMSRSCSFKCTEKKSVSDS